MSEAVPSAAATATGAPEAPRPGPLRTIARVVLRSTQGRVVLLLLAAWLIYQGWLSAAAPGKVVGEFPADREKLAVLVTLPFPPERFHVLVFQRFGRVSGTDGTTDAVMGSSRFARASSSAVAAVLTSSILPCTALRTCCAASPRLSTAWASSGFFGLRVTILGSPSGVHSL